MRRSFNPTVEKMVGEILVERNIIPPRFLQLALDRQKEEKLKYKYLGEILIEMGIPQQKINEALDGYNKRKPIGQVFLDLNIITPDQLQAALEKQSQFAGNGVHKPLGKILVEMGFATNKGYREALSKHFNMAIVSLRRFFPSASLQRAIGKAYAQKHKIVVLEDYAKGIKLALAEPDRLVMDELRRAFPAGKSIEFCLADHSEVGNCLKEI
jgi:hypothetical protein